MGINDSGKIALFAPSLVGGGAERVMVNLARGMVEQGKDVDLVLAKAEGPYLADVPSDVRVVDLNAKRVLTSLPALVRYLRQERPVALLSALDHANIVALWAVWLARVNTRVVVSVHNTISRDSENAATLRGKLGPRLIKLFYPSAYKVVVVSEAAKEDLLLATGLSPESVMVILNPVVTPDLFEKARLPLRHPWFACGEPPVILGVGRLTKQKDFPTLISAFAVLRQQFEARLMIIGEGEERQKLENMVAELGLGEDVSLPGFDENPYAYMAHAKVFVLSSLYEGLPTVLIESLAVGTPIVSTDCPSGPREILDNGRYGTLVPVGDKQAIAQSVLTVLQNASSSDTPVDAWAPFELSKVTSMYLAVLVGDKVA